MPAVIVEMWEGRTVEQKRNLVKAISEAMENHAKVKNTHLHVIIHEVSKENWGREGILAIDMKKEEKK